MLIRDDVKVARDFFYDNRSSTVYHIAEEALDAYSRVSALYHGAAKEHRQWVSLDELRRAMEGK